MPITRPGPPDIVREPGPGWLRSHLPGLLGGASEQVLEPAPGLPMARGDGVPFRPASVLVPVVMAARPLILLTKRSSALRHHPGQVSFPGGQIDPDDRDPEMAALREAYEEIGLDPTACEVVGRLPTQPTGSQFLVTPVVALVRPDAAWRAAPDEVDEILFLPVANLLDPGAVSRREVCADGARHSFWVWHHPKHVIWGATAGILMSLAERLRSAFLE